MSGRGWRPGAGRSAVRTFLIADIRGYTRFTAQHGDEAASRLAASFAEVVGEGVEAWGGELVELRGDEALAVFDSSRDALRCAAELQDAFADETASQPERPMGVGIGLDAGEAVPVGDGYRGAALNFAARLCGVAGPGEILASQSLAHLAGAVDGLRLEPRAVEGLKGLDGVLNAVAVAAIVAPAAAPASGPSEESGGTTALPPELEPIVPLVGRDGELRWLRWHWRRARHGHGRVVVVSGQPGIGKTRLVAELAGDAAADGAAIRYHPTARGLPEHPGGVASPTLRIVDDLDAAAAGLQAEVARLAARTVHGSELLVVIHREAAAASLRPTIARLAPAERQRELGPLGSDAIRAIAALYAGSSTEPLPLEQITTDSGGVPVAVHRVAGQWARLNAARRLGDAAERTAAGRHEIRTAEAELIGTVSDLELADERARLYASDRDGPAVVDRTICPYKGLAAFEAADADYYFGRERLVAELIARLVGASFLGLIGASGSGKSSAVRAALLPALAGGVLPGSDGWLQVLGRPGEHPLTELRQALARVLPAATPPPADAPAMLDAVLAGLPAGRQLVVVIDQFEEVFGQTRDEADRGGFIELLTTERPGLRVVVTLRADHYGHCAGYPALARLLAANQVLVGPLTPAELAAVVEHPAQRVGLRIEPGLTEALVADAGAEPGVLPLLSTTLLELWRAREGGRLTLAAYRLTGGLRGAVARLAEAAWAELDPGQQAVARSIFLRLAGPGEGEGLVRRRVPLDELDAERDPVVAGVLDRLTAARLLTTGEGTVEVAHEALLREWPRLQGWLEEDEAGRRVRLHLIGAVRDWEQRGREPGDLYRGARLAAGLDWAAEHRVELNDAEREFLEASRVASQRAVERERRRNRRLRGLLVGALVLLVVALGAGTFAVDQAGVARDQAALAATRANEARVAEERAIAAQRFARSRELAASAIGTLTEDPTVSRLLAVAAARHDAPDLEVQTALHRVIAEDPVVDRYTLRDAAPDDELWTHMHPDGELIVASAGNRGPVDRFEVVELASDEVLWSFTPPSGASVSPPFFTSDGGHLVAGVVWDPGPGEEGSIYDAAAIGIHLWEARTGRTIERIEIGRCGAWVEAISDVSAMVRPFPEGPDTPTDCFANDPGPLLEVVRLEDGTRTRVSTSASDDRVISRDGRFVAFSNLDDGFAGAVVEVATGKQVLRVDPATSGAQDGVVRALSADGSRLLFGTRPSQIILVADGSRIASVGGEGGEGGEGRFSPDGRMVYATARDRSLRGWDARTGIELVVVPAVGSGVPTPIESGLVLVTDPDTRSALVIDPRPRGEVGIVRTCDGFTAGDTLQVHGDLAMFAGFCGDSYDGDWSAHVVDPARHEVIRKVPDHAGQSLKVSADGTKYVHQTSSAVTVIEPPRVRDIRTDDVLVELEGVCSWDQAVFAENDPNCRIFPERPFAFRNWAMAWSPDGRLIAATHDFPGFLVVWDAVTGKLVHTVERSEDDGFHHLIFSEDSKRLIASTSAREIQALSTDTWEVVASRTLDGSIVGADRVGFGGFSADGSTLIAVTAYASFVGGSLLRLDAETFDVLTRVDAHEGSPKAINLSPDRSLVVTGSSDGVLRVWESSTGRLLHHVPFGGQVQGAAFIDDRHIAVTPHQSHLLIITIDPAELIDIAARSLTRGFTEAECARFNFGDDCPTLEELRDGG